MTKSKRSAMSDEHKKALEKGRAQSRAVKAYLAALKNNKPKRGRKRTSESIAKRLGMIEDQLKSADALQEVLLLQEQSDLERELSAMESDVDMSSLEAEFIKVAQSYAAAKGIEYSTWRKVGVGADILAKAGIKR